MFGLNCYYNSFDLGTGGAHDDQYAYPTVGPVKYARMAVNGYDNRGEESADPSCIKKKVAMIRANATILNSVLVFTEAGANYHWLGMTDNPVTDPVRHVSSSRTANYYISQQRTGEAVLAYFDGLRNLAVEWVTLYTISDASQDESFGAFDDGMSNSNVPTLQTLKTFASAVAWARRAGLPTANPDPGFTSADRGNYWNKEFKKGGSEVVT